MDFLMIFEKSLLGGIAAVGFAILFNAFHRTLSSIFCLGALGIFLKVVALSFDVNIILATFIGAASIGMLSQWVSYLTKTPILIISIPSVIPMIPGTFLYRMMIGFVRMTGNVDDNEFLIILSNTINNGVKAVFILMVLALGISLPYLIARKDSVNYFKGFINVKDRS
jgi:uncharacterized membrane protein YjjB (DUF3815 family)